MSDPVKEKQPARLVSFRLPGFARVEGLPSVVVFALVVGLFMATAPRVFLGWPIYFSFLTTVPPMAVLAIGLTLVIAAGEIDLSSPR